MFKYIFFLLLNIKHEQRCARSLDFTSKTIQGIGCCEKISFLDLQDTRAGELSLQN